MMICFVDIEHKSVLDDPEQRVTHLGRRLEVALRLQEVAGVPCLYQHYLTVDRAFVRRNGIRALLLSGQSTDWAAYDFRTFEGLAEILRDGETPVIGFCGGHQLIGSLAGAPLERMGRLAPGEADAADYESGWRKEWGYLPVDIIADDPLFEGLGRQPIMRQAHAWELKDVPPGFELLATRPTCRIQAIRRKGALVYGVQFHPESFTDEAPAGRRLLENFFVLAGIRSRAPTARAHAV